jgi:GntR family transcriptional regulator
VATHAEQHVQYRFLKLMPDSGDPTARARPSAMIECKRVRASAEVARALACAPGDAGAAGAPRAVFWRRAHHPGRHLAARAGLQGPDAPNRWPATRAHLCHVRSSSSACAWCAPKKNPRRAADAAQATLLTGPARQTPLLSVERVAYTYNDVPMELRRGLYRTDTHHYRNDLS